MKISYLLAFGVVIGIHSQTNFAGSITETFATGDTLTATHLNNVKTAVNDNDSRVTTNKADITNNAADIVTNTSGVSTNSSNIQNNTTNIGLNASGILTNASNISTNSINIGINTADIAANTADIATNAADIANQVPAVKQAIGAIWTIMPTVTNTNINSITVTPPADGYVIVTATGEVIYDFTTGGSNGSICLALNNITNDTGACVPNSSTGKALRTSIPSASPSTTAGGWPYSIVKVFPVSASTSSTFYLNGYGLYLDSAYLFHPTLTALFVPNALP